MNKFKFITFTIIILLTSNLFAANEDEVIDQDGLSFESSAARGEDESSSVDLNQAKSKLRDGINKNKDPIVMENEVDSQSKIIPKLNTSHPALRPLSKTMREKGYEIEYLLTRFSSTSNIDENGADIAFPQSVFFNKNDHQFILRYGYSNEVEFRLGGKFRQVSANNSTNDLSNNGTESIFAGFRYGLSKLNWLFAFDLEFAKTAYETTDYASGVAPLNEIVLGDDGTSSKVGLQMSYLRTANHFLNFSAHYQNPGRDLSSDIPYHADSTWAWQSFAVAIGVDGIVSLKTDQDGNDLAHRPVRATSPTKLFNSVNREMVTPYAGLKFVWDKLGIGASYGQTIKGVSTDKGSEIKLSISWNNFGVSEERVKENQFKEYNIDAQIIKVSPRETFVKIDHGFSQDVEKGMRFDIFRTDYFGENVMIAQAFAYEVGSDWAILKISRTYRNIPIKKGFSARAE